MSLLNNQPDPRKFTPSKIKVTPFDQDGVAIVGPGILFRLPDFRTCVVILRHDKLSQRCIGYFQNN